MDVLRQVEYYLSDENLPYDDYFLSRMVDGVIPASDIARCNRIIEYTPDMAPEERVNLILKVVSDSDTVKSEGQGVKRLRPLPLDDDAVGVYVRFKELPDDATLDKVGPHRKLRDLRETRDYTGEVIFEVPEVDLQAEEILPCKEYFLRRHAFLSSQRKRGRQGAILSFTGARPNLDRETLKDICSLDGTIRVAYVTYDRGDETGHVRFNSPQDAKAVYDKLCDQGPEHWELLSNDQEDAYWTQVKRRRTDSPGGRGKRASPRTNTRGRGGGRHQRRGRGI